MTQSRIEELERVRKEIGYWRGGAFGVIALSIVASAGLLFSDARGLVAQGPTQDRFVAKLQEGLNEHVVPRIKEVASSSLTEMQPVVQAEFSKLNQRVPEVTEASLKQLDELQKSLPEKSEKVVNETLGEAIKSAEPDIRNAFPDLDNEGMTRLVENFTHIASSRSAKIGESLLGGHMRAMKRIQYNLGRIAATEASTKGENVENWQVGLAVFDVLRSDLETAKPAGKPVKKATKENKA